MVSAGQYPPVNPVKFILLCLAGWMQREQQAVIDYLQEEIRVLKEAFGEKKPRFSDAQRIRLAAKAKKVKFGRLKEIASIVTPQTLLRWYREWVAKKYDSSRRRRRGRPTTPEEIAQLVVRIAADNERWGYTRIRDALMNLGHEISRDTVANILRCHGLEPAPERGKKTSWAQFLKRHWEVMAATDMFTVEIWSLAGMVRYHVFFVMRLATREVQIAGIADQPTGAWATQAVRSLCDGLGGFLSGCRFLIHDRDPLFGTPFDQVLASSAIESVRLPSRSPNLNAYAERFVRSIKSECLDQRVFFSENSLRHAISQFAEHYPRERNHQGLDNRIIRPEFVEPPQHGEVRCRERLGGLLNYYYRQAA